MANKVQFGIKNVHYALDTTTTTTQTWGTPVAVKGAVSISLAPVGDATKFYADNGIYFASSANQGYEGTLELAYIPEGMLKDIFGYAFDGTDKTLVENASAEPKHFALGFQFDGDDSNDLFWMYDCVAERPTIASSTINASKEPATTALGITASPLADGRTYARTGADTTTSVVSAWFTSVYEQ